MVVRLEVRTEEYRGIVCAFICNEDGSIYVEIKEAGKKTKNVVRIYEYLDILNSSVA